MNPVDPYSQYLETIKDNLNILSQNALKDPFDFKVVEDKIQLNHFIEKIFYKIFYSKETLEYPLKSCLTKNISFITGIQKSFFLKSLSIKEEYSSSAKGGSSSAPDQIGSSAHPSIKRVGLRLSKSFDEDNAYSDLFIAAQKYNQTVAECKRSKKGLLSEWENILVIQKDLPELIPLELGQEPEVIFPILMEGIPPNQHSFIQKEGVLQYYFKRTEPAPTQWERMSGAIGIQLRQLIRLIKRIIEKIAAFFESREVYPKCPLEHNEKGERVDIYKNDPPITPSQKPSFFWNGDSAILMRLLFPSDIRCKIPVNIMTDPNDEIFPDLRMTKPARLIEECPAIHLCLITNDQKDHLNIATLKKLLPQQPIMLVPLGVKGKVQALGFNNVFELNWWNSITIPFKRANATISLTIHALPSRHWSVQGLDNQPISVSYLIVHRQNLRDVNDDIFFLGDSAPLLDEQIAIIRKQFNVKTIFQGGDPEKQEDIGPDPGKKVQLSREEEIKRHPQTQVDGLAIYMKLLIQKLYDPQNSPYTLKNEWIDQARKKQLKTYYIHSNLNDLEKSIQRVFATLRSNLQLFDSKWKEMNPQEQLVYHEICNMAGDLTFYQSPMISNQQLCENLEAGIARPKIGQRCEIGEN